MRYSQLLTLISETELSPEGLSSYFSVSNMTLRRWQKEEPNLTVPEEYQTLVREGIYRLITEGYLQVESKAVGRFLNSSDPEYFKAAMTHLGVEEELRNSDPHAGPPDFNNEVQMILMLTQIGMRDKNRKSVTQGGAKLLGFKKMGQEWGTRITSLMKVLRSDRFRTSDKVVAFGALFYLLTPFDLIPDHIPVIGLLDDFGVLGLALAYYLRSFPAEMKRLNED